MKKETNSKVAKRIFEIAEGKTAGTKRVGRFLKKARGTR
jgi:hypothetical protein